MGKIRTEIIKLSHNYKRKGSKTNRRQQVNRIHYFCKWVETNYRITSIHQIGKKHVIDFYRNHHHLADSTIHRGYFPAIRLFWELLNRPGNPPAPFTPAELIKE